MVEQKLELCWSPQQIAAWLSRTYPDCQARRISHETIYLSLFVPSRGALPRELTTQLPRARDATLARLPAAAGPRADHRQAHDQ